jgi:hypothetical protein
VFAEGCAVGDHLGGVTGGDGEVEVGLVAQGREDGFEGGGEGGPAEPLAEDGGGGPELGGRAVGVGVKGSEKKSLALGGAFDSAHKLLLCSWLW